jgi:hypothetical protein
MHTISMTSCVFHIVGVNDDLPPANYPETACVGAPLVGAQDAGASNYAYELACAGILPA